MNRPLICGFLKVRDEIIRGNLHRALDNLQRYCDCLVCCDDASTDGTRETLQSIVPADRLVLVPHDTQDFKNELVWKQKMLEIVHRLEPYWVFWADADEVLDRAGTEGLSAWAESVYSQPEIVWRFHFTQMWRSTNWARNDGEWDSAWFLKLWKWSPTLSFEIVDRLHYHQFPGQLLVGPRGDAPFDVLHYGNVGVSLRWKNIQYHENQESIRRHLYFQGASYRPVDQVLLPPGAESVPGETPQPFSNGQAARILALESLRSLRGYFCVVVPAYNRAQTLPCALASLLAQTYEKWVAIVLDDGSTDDTPQIMREWQERDPRIFYCRYPVRRGGVAMNEIGMAMACEMAEYWTRLGSDDWFEPHKLENDAAALVQHEAVYGPYTVMREGQAVGVGRHLVAGELCNPVMTPDEIRGLLLSGTFVVSWANCAVRTSVLRCIREKYGNFCDPRLKNMEDFLMDARIARECDWIWRGIADGSLIVAPSLDVAAPLRGHPDRLQPDAYWTAATQQSASTDHSTTAKDDALSRQIIAEENISWRGAG